MINNSIQYSNTFHEGYHLSHPKLLLSIWMVDLMYYLTNPLCFDVPLLDSYIDLVSSIICFLFSDDIGVFFYISIFFFFCLWISLWIILRWIISNFIGDFITNQITSCFCCFLNSSFSRSFRCICSICRCICIFYPYFLANNKIP